MHAFFGGQLLLLAIVGSLSVLSCQCNFLEVGSVRSDEFPEIKHKIFDRLTLLQGVLYYFHVDMHAEPSAT